LLSTTQKFDDTEKIAKALEAGMQGQWIAAKCAKVEEGDINKLSEHALFAVGGSTHMRTASKSMKHFWKNSAGLMSEARRRCLRHQSRVLAC